MSVSGSPALMGTSSAGVTPTLKELIALQGQAATLPLGHGRSAASHHAGAHIFPHRGRGMDFAEVRAYQPGDDIRAMDWRQTARRGRPYTKVFHEERERPTRVLVDMSPSMHFGTRLAFKSVAAARAAALLAWCAAGVGDRVGGGVWNGAAYREVPARARRQGVLGLLHLLTGKPGHDAGAMDLAAVLARVAGRLRTGDRLVLISDFRSCDAGMPAAFDRIAQTGELLLVHVYDAFEAEAPPPGRYTLTDGRAIRVLDVHDAVAREAHGAAFRARRARLQSWAQKSGARLVFLATHEPPVPALRGLLA